MGEKEDRLKISSEYIKRSERALKAAEELLKLGLFEDSISRSYYAAFNASKGLIYLLGEEPKTHKGLHSLFGLKVIKTKILDEKYGRYLSKLLSYRETADYNVFSFISKDDADEAIKIARLFVEGIKKAITDLKR